MYERGTVTQCKQVRVIIFRQMCEGCKHVCVTVGEKRSLRAEKENLWSPRGNHISNSSGASSDFKHFSQRRSWTSVNSGSARCEWVCPLKYHSSSRLCCLDSSFCNPSAWPFAGTSWVIESYFDTHTHTPHPLLLMHTTHTHTLTTSSDLSLSLIPAHQGHLARLPRRRNSEEGWHLRPLFQRWKIVSHHYFGRSFYL